MKRFPLLNNLLWLLFYLFFAAFAIVFNKTGTWIVFYFLTLFFIVSGFSLLFASQPYQLKQKDVQVQPISGKPNEVELTLISPRKTWIPHAEASISIHQQSIESERFTSFLANHINLNFKSPLFARGIYPDLQVTLYYRDFFGILYRTQKLKTSLRLTIYPTLQSQQATTIADFLNQYHHELFYELDETNFDLKKVRPYLPGDRINQIDWKLTSKKQELIFREFERDKTTYPVYLFLGVYHHDYEIMLSLYYSFITQQIKQSEAPYYLFNDESLWLHPSPNQFATLDNTIDPLQQFIAILDQIDKQKTIILFTTHPESALIEFIRSLGRQRPILLLYLNGSQYEVISSTSNEEFSIPLRGKR